MAQTLIEFLALSLATAVVLTLLVLNARLKVRLKDARNLSVNLLESIAFKDFTNSILRAKANDLEAELDSEDSFCKAVRDSQGALLTKLHKELLKAKSDASFLETFPLFYVSDEELPEVIKQELLQRFYNAVNPDHKLASQCGGKAFRVVDAIKRGKLV